MKMAKNLKRMMSLLAAVVLIFSFTAATVSAETASDAKNSVVAIESAEGFGTGFAIGKKGQPVEYVVTNNHVVNGGANTTATVYFNLAANKMMLANVCYYNESKDIAILKLPEPTNEREPLVLCTKEHLAPDDVYYALGYPATGIAVTEWLQFSPNDITVTRGGIKKNDSFQGLDVYYLDLDITYGNSGGPLVNSKGEAVGITRGAALVDLGDEFLYDENQAITIDELVKILKTEEIPFSQAGSINWILIGGGVVLLAIIVLVVILIVRKKGNNGGSEYAGTNYTMPLDNGANPTTPQQPAAKASARVIAIGGTLNGKRYSVTGVVKIGRDASKCAIAFPVNTQGVSGVHCEVAFDGAVCYVKDLNSSYGTFTIDGKKLAPNVPQILRSGDKFYLASPEHTFEVRF